MDCSSLQNVEGHATDFMSTDGHSDLAIDET
jgi:hypothetical protein